MHRQYIVISYLQSSKEETISFYYGLDLMEEGTRILIVYFFNNCKWQ